MNQAVRNMRRMFSVVAGILIVTGTIVVPAYAAPPANDSISQPARLTTIPHTFVHDSSEATAAPTDGRCVRGASIWYRYRPTTTSTLRVVTFGSDYDTVLAVFRGRQSNRTLVACSDDTETSFSSAVRRSFRAGRRYFIAVSACCRPDARGGRSVLTFYRDRAAGVHTTIESVQSGEISGRIFVKGSTRCDTPSAAAVNLTISQRLGDHVARGGGFVDTYCSGARRSWRVAIDSETGWAFRPGQAALDAQSFSDDGFDFVSAEQTMTVSVGSDPNARSR
jgi:hypothetical protein